jgi:SAM-dependent methyltransferase
MAKSLITLQVGLVLFAVSCSRNEQSPAPAETGTISLQPKAAHEPESGPPPPERTPSTPIRAWERVEHLPDRIALFDSVFWDLRDTVSLRKLIAETPLVKDKSVLEIGTGSGLLSLYCLKFGAREVVATDVNQLAVENARYNAEQLGLGERLQVRLVPLDDAGAYSVIGASERFDLIISNPSWEDAKPDHIAHYAYYDPGFALLHSLVGGLREHLNADGRALLAYGSVDGIDRLKRLCSEDGLRVRILDDRDLDLLPAVFVPGMLLEVSR